MKKTTKINATLILVLILMSLNSMQINSLITGEKLDNLNNCKTETGESFIESKITAKNDYDYTISGPTGEVSHPKIAYTDNDQIIIVWREDGSLFKISKYTSNLSRIIVPYIILNASSLTLDNYSLSDPKLLIDSDDNLILMWQLLGFDDPQQENVYYLKMNNNLEIIVQPKIIHIYTHSGYTNTYSDSLIKSYFLDSNDSLHILFAGNHYYVLTNTGELKASISIPGELGSVERLLLDNEENVLALCENSNTDEINSIKYTIDETTIIELSRNLLFNTTEKLVEFITMLNIGNSSYFLWSYSNGTHMTYSESYQINLNGSLGDPVILSHYFFMWESLCLNSTHIASIYVLYTLNGDAEIYYMLYDPMQWQTFYYRTLLIRYQENRNYLYSPMVYGFNIIQDKESQFILSWFVNDGRNEFQIILWKCTYNGTTPLPLVIVAPEEDREINSTVVIAYPKLSLMILIFIMTDVTIKLLKRKKRIEDINNNFKSV